MSEESKNVTLDELSDKVVDMAYHKIVKKLIQEESGTALQIGELNKRVLNLMTLGYFDHCDPNICATGKKEYEHIEINLICIDLLLPHLDRLIEEQIKENDKTPIKD